MKFLKPILLIVTVLALTYTVSAANKSFKGSLNNSAKTSASVLTFNGNPDIQQETKELPLNGDIMFAFIAIASLGSYLAFKK